MRSEFDRRVLSNEAIELLRACQRVVPARFGGEAALSAAFLCHRLSGDVDLVCDSVEEVRSLVGHLPAIERESRAAIQIVRDAGTFVRASVDFGSANLTLDVIQEGAGRIDPHEPIVEGIALEPLADLRASKITCILSRSEPRDLVDLLFLERAGFPIELDLENALQKDGGIDPGVLGWLLAQFPVRPLPNMLVPFEERSLLEYRDDLRKRLLRLAVPEEG